MPRDGLPVCLADVVQYYGHTHYKLKLSGDAHLDIDRLEKINTVIEESAKVITLDGNEQYTSGDQFTQFFEKFKASSKLKSLSQKTTIC
jgi:L-alanine-DL-glutamate epimerase-like enolase superfamily enzyme